MKHLVSLLVVSLLTIGSTACRTDFKEVHFYRVDTAVDSAVDTANRELPNYFRLTISGDASFSKAKYISGCYDERAIQIVFDEIGSTPDTAAVKFLSGGQMEIAGAKVATVGEESEVCPPGKSKMMIFSTNAKVVADTIGAFAESQVVAESVLGLLQADDLRELGRQEGELAVQTSGQTAETREITALVATLPGGDEPDPAATRAATLRILTAIARAQGRFEPFGNEHEARAWFQAQFQTQQTGGSP